MIEHIQTELVQRLEYAREEAQQANDAFNTINAKRIQLEAFCNTLESVSDIGIKTEDNQNTVLTAHYKFGGVEHMVIITEIPTDDYSNMSDDYSMFCGLIIDTLEKQIVFAKDFGGSNKIVSEIFDKFMGLYIEERFGV